MPNVDPTEAHAVLSPSSAERWTSCPASVRMERGIEYVGEQIPSVYALEGTAAHELAHLMARTSILHSLTDAQFGRAMFKWRQAYGHVVDDESVMIKHVEGYLNFVIGQMESGSAILLEQRLPTGIPSCWGTSDAVVVTPSVVHITDLKYGQGNRVDVIDNPQLLLYGVGALEAFGDVLGDIETVRMSVYQPRIDNIATTEISAADIRGWRDSVIPIAEEALGPNARFGPSESACRWCAAAGQCKAQTEWVLARDFGHLANSMTPDELRLALDAVPAIEKWCAAVRAHSLNTIYSGGGEVPGYKVVMSTGKRFVRDEAGALEALTLIGYELNEIVNQKIKGIGELEKLLGRKTFAQVMTQFLGKSGGNPSLVADDDNRPSATPNTEAARVFAAHTDITDIPTEGEHNV